MQTATTVLVIHVELMVHVWKLPVLIHVYVLEDIPELTAIVCVMMSHATTMLHVHSVSSVNAA